MNFKEFLLRCDFLGRTQMFTISKKNTFQTFIGSIISIIIVVLMTYFIFYFGLQVIQRKKPNVISTIYNDPDPGQTNLTSDNFGFTIGLQNPDYSLYINESIYTINLTLFTVIKERNGIDKNIITPLSIIPCSKYTVKIIPEYFELMDLDNLYCINPSTDIYLKGDFGQNNWTYLNFEFNKCINSSLNNNSCASQEEIDSRLDGGYIGMFMTDLDVIPNNFRNPTSFYGKNVFTTFSAREYLDLWVYLKRIELNTDSGLLLNSNHNEEFFGLDTYRETRDYRNGNNFLTVKMRMSLSRNVYDRSYEKLQTIAADIGGIMKLCLVVGEVLVYFFREILYKDFLASFFFSTSQMDILGQGINGEQSCSTRPFYSNRKLNTIWMNRENSNIHTVINNKSKNSPKPKFLLNPSNKMSETYYNSILSYRSNQKNCPINQKVISIPPKRKKKIKYRYLFCPCIFNKKIKNAISSIIEYYSRISFCFDVVYYMKMKNDITLINKKVFEDYQFSFYIYNFELPSIQESEIFNYYIGKGKMVKKE